MALYGWDNEQKDRYIYLLLFHDRRVYVGQSGKPITLDGLTFDFSSFRDRSKTQGERLPWPFIT